MLVLVAFNESGGHGRQMLPGGRKSKSALPSGYFSEKFSRVLEGESYTDPVKMRRQDRMKEAQKIIGKPFVPSSGEKKMYDNLLDDFCYLMCLVCYLREIKTDALLLLCDEFILYKSSLLVNFSCPNRNKRLLCKFIGCN